MRAMPVGPAIPEATLEWLRLHTKAKEMPLIFYERGFVDGVYTHTDRQRAYGSQQFAVAIKEAVSRLGDTNETVFTANDVVKFS